MSAWADADWSHPILRVAGQPESNRSRTPPIMPANADNGLALRFGSWLTGSGLPHAMRAWNRLACWHMRTPATGDPAPETELPPGSWRRARLPVFAETRPPFPACFQVTHLKIFLSRLFSGSRSACFHHASPRPGTTHADDNRTWRACPAALHAVMSATPARHQPPAKGAGRGCNAGTSTSRLRRMASGEQNGMNEHHGFAAIPPITPCLLPGDTHEIKGFPRRQAVGFPRFHSPPRSQQRTMFVSACLPT